MKQCDINRILFDASSGMVLPISSKYCLSGRKAYYSPFLSMFRLLHAGR